MSVGECVLHVERSFHSELTKLLCNCRFGPLVLMDTARELFEWTMRNQDGKGVGILIVWVCGCREQAATLLNRARELSQRVAKFGNKLSTETETLSDEAKRLFKMVNDALDQASRELEVWQGEAQSGSLSGAVEEVVQLENALSILHGHGPGGDL